METRVTGNHLVLMLQTEAEAINIVAVFAFAVVGIRENKLLKNPIVPDLNLAQTRYKMPYTVTEMRNHMVDAHGVHSVPSPQQSCMRCRDVHSSTSIDWMACSTSVPSITLGRVRLSATLDKGTSIPLEFN